MPLPPFPLFDPEFAFDISCFIQKLTELELKQVGDSQSSIDADDKQQLVAVALLSP